MLDPGPQGVDGPSLVAVCSMFFFLVSPESLLLDTLEDELQNIRINVCSPAVRKHDGVEFFEGSFGCDFEAFILKY